MGVSVQPVSDTPGQKIQRQIAAIKQQGGTDDDVATFLSGHPQVKQEATPGNPGRGFMGATESTVQGMLGGFGDEIGGAGAAAIDALDNKLHGLPADFGKNYRMYRDTARGLDKGFEEAHPIAHAVAEIAGSVPTMLLTAGGGEGEEALNLGNRIREGIKSGVKVGSVYGAGNAEGGLRQRASGAFTGGVMGGALGAAAPAVASVINAGPKALQATTGIGTKSVAMQRIADMVRDAGMTPAQVEEKGLALKAQGAPVVFGEIPGDLGREHIEFVTGQPSAKGLALGTKLAERHEGQFDRIMSGVRSATGSDFLNIPQTEDELIAAQKAHAQPNYEEAYASGPFNSPNLQAARQIPQFQEALHKGENLAYLDDVKQAMEKGEPMPTFTPTKAGQPVSIKALDYAKRDLDDTIRSGANSGSSFTRTEAQNTSGILKHVLSEVDESNPAYAKARSIYHSDARIRDVLNTAKGAVHMAPDELDAWTKTLSPDEFSLAQKRFLSEVKAKAGNVNDRNDLTKQFLQNPNMRQRFQTMFPGQDVMDALGGLREREAGMARTHFMVNTGSRTAPRTATSDAMESVVGPGQLAAGVVSPRYMARQLFRDAGSLVRRHTQKALADEMAPLLGAEPGTPVFRQLVEALDKQGKGVNALADNHHFLHLLSRGLAVTPAENQK